MEYRNRLQEFGAGPSDAEIAGILARAAKLAAGNANSGVYKTCMSCLDLTTLGPSDNEESVAAFAKKALEMATGRRDVPMVASICVYPNFVDTVGLAVGDSGVRITSVAGGFPSAQTYLEVKMLEAAMAVENGADEIDVVMNPGQIIAGRYEEAANEIETIRGEIGEDVTLKVIIEAGELPSRGHVRTASLLAMMAGADFVKTSTGKGSVGATPEAAAEMCCAIRHYTASTGRKVGFKAAGGIKTAYDAVLYYSIVETALGREWLDPSLFRIGASSLASDLLTNI